MEVPKIFCPEGTDRLIKRVAQSADVTVSQVLLFGDFTDAVTELVQYLDPPHRKVLVVGHAEPNLAIAVDRAGSQLVEIQPDSPFTADFETILNEISGGAETVCVANPNPITGIQFSFSELRRMAAAVSDGTLIVDERYFEFLGITAMPLLRECSNLVVIRSFSPESPHNAEAGFIVAPAVRIDHLGGSYRWRNMSASLRERATSALSNQTTRTERMKTVQEELRRMCGTLSRLGVQFRFSPTDFLLLRVAQPTQVGNWMAAAGTPIDNLDGYPGLRQYVRYFVRNRVANDRFLDAFQRMPSEYYRMPDRGIRSAVLRRRGERPKTVSIGEAPELVTSARDKSVLANAE
jgi:histidinol-phosphate/aromatic aminotransferase/cobyric acid decarboxylase-like protein